MSISDPAARASQFRLAPRPPEQPALFVDHEPEGRSGHLGHALFQNREGRLCAFFSNCTGKDNSGHSAIGWMEYKTSDDGGRSWTPARPFELSKAMHDRQPGRTLFTEKGVVTDTGAVVLFHLVCDIERTAAWEPYHVPFATRSDDGGQGWSAPIAVGVERGRIYDALCVDDAILVLKFRNDATQHYCGVSPEHVYELYRSVDDGRSFERISTLPLDTRGRCYGTLGRLADGSLVAYVYDTQDETQLDSVVSNDGGLTWTAPVKRHFAKRLRNPQFVALDGAYFMHGRSGNDGSESERGHVVLYRSDDGLNWDNGEIIARRTAGIGAYSNSIVIIDPVTRRRRVRIHSSHAYAEHRTNIVSWWLDSPGARVSSAGHLE